jgi:putative ABC transport system permease protein
MRLPHGVRRAFRLLAPGAYRDEVDEELRCHLEMKTEELVEAGMDPEAAAREARRRFGDPDRIAGECRSVARTREASERRAGLRDELVQDLRWALRRLRGEPGFALAIVAILALGIGAATALFSVADAVLFRPLPYPEPERLVWIAETTPEGDPFSVSLPNFFDWRRETEGFSGLAALQLRNASLTGDGGEPRKIQSAPVTEGFFELLGIRPALGALLPEEAFAQGGDEAWVVLSDGLWRRAFGADPGIVGTAVLLDARATRVAGVLPPDVGFYEDAEAWTPLREDARWDRDEKEFQAIGRLEPGVSLEAAEADLAGIANGLGERHPEANQGWSVRVTGLHEFLIGPEVQRTLLVLLGAVGLLLLIACVNVSSLLVARGSGRSREMAVRVSLGAPRRRLARQLLVEAAALGLLGGLSGLALAWVAVETVRRFAPPGVPRLAEAGLDTRVLAFSIAAALLSSLLFGLLPALQTSRTRPGEDLRAGGRTSAAATARTRGFLVVTQLALAVTLLVGAGLTARSYLRLLGVDPGFDAGDVLAVRVDLPEADFPAAHRQAVAGEIHGRLAALPGVEAAAATVGGLYSGFDLANEFATPGSEPLSTGGYPVAQWRIVTPGYFETLDVPLLRGRRLTEEDRETKAFVVTRAFAERFWPGDDAVGRRIHFGGADPGDDPWTVVGVVADVRDTRLSEAPLPTVYVAYQQIPWMFQTWLVEAEGEPAAVAAAVRAELRRLLPGVPVPEVLPLADDLGRARANPRFQALLMAVFALSAASLAAAGVYGLMAFAVARRSREIGIRLALGARQASVVRMIARQGAVLVAVGTALGLAGALALARSLESLLYETAPAEPATYGAAAGLLAGAALLAAYLPARRAAAVDPTVALAAE